MKRLFRFAVCVLLCLALTAANLCFSTAAEKFFSEAEMLLIKDYIEDDIDLGVYSTIQGACTDGKYAYFALTNGVTTIMKYDINTWELVDKQNIVNMGHSNDMTYNSNKKYLVVVNNAPYYDTLTLIDAETLDVIKDVQIKADVYSIAYNAKRKQYVVGISGSYDYTLLNEDFSVIKDEDKVKLIKEEKEKGTEKYKKMTDDEVEEATQKIYSGVNTGYTRQGCDCDNNYVYFVQSGGGNVVVVYDYEGNHIDTVPIGDSDEVENMFHVGNTYYVTMYYYGNRLHRIGFSDTSKITYKVIYDANGGEGSMEPTVVHYGTPTKLRKCSFSKEGYFFGGWRAQRDCDGKYIGYRVGEKDYGWVDGEEVLNYLPYYDEETVSETVRYGNLKLSAIWINEKYGIEFDTDGGEGSMEPMTVAYNEVFTVPESGFSKEGYVFDGFSAIRYADGRTYGYSKGSDKPEWLNSADVDRMYIFKPGEKAKKLTYDGNVTLTARYKFAYTFGDDGSTLVEYVGVDEKVIIPANSGELKTLAQGAIKDNDTMTELYIPAGVSALKKQAVSNCPKLRSIYFEGGIPKEFDPASVSGADAPAVYKIHDGQAFCIGFYADDASSELIKCHAFSFDKAVKNNMYAR